MYPYTPIVRTKTSSADFFISDAVALREFYTAVGQVDNKDLQKCIHKSMDTLASLWTKRHDDLIQTLNQLELSHSTLQHESQAWYAKYHKAMRDFQYIKSKYEAIIMLNHHHHPQYHAQHYQPLFHHYGSPHQQHHERQTSTTSSTSSSSISRRVLPTPSHDHRHSCLSVDSRSTVATHASSTSTSTDDSCLSKATFHSMSPMDDFKSFPINCQASSSLSTVCPSTLANDQKSSVQPVSVDEEDDDKFDLAAVFEFSYDRAIPAPKPAPSSDVPLPPLPASPVRATSPPLSVVSTSPSQKDTSTACEHVPTSLSLLSASASSATPPPPPPPIEDEKKAEDNHLVLTASKEINNIRRSTSVYYKENKTKDNALKVDIAVLHRASATFASIPSILSPPSSVSPPPPSMSPPSSTSSPPPISTWTEELEFACTDGFWKIIAEGKTMKEEAATAVEKYLKNGGNPNVANNSGSIKSVKEGYGLIHALIVTKNSVALQRILKAAANPHALPLSNEKEDTISPLVLAARLGYLRGVRLLIECAHVNVLASKGPLQENALLAAIQADACDVVVYLLKYCPQLLHQADVSGATALHYASMAGKLRMMIFLVNKCGQSTEVVDYKGQTPLHYAIRHRRAKAVDLLVNELGAYPNPYVLKKVPTPLDLAKSGGLHKIAEKLRKIGAKTVKEMEKSASSSSAGSSSSSASSGNSNQGSAIVMEPATVSAIANISAASLSSSNCSTHSGKTSSSNESINSFSTKSLVSGTASLMKSKLEELMS